MNGIAGAARASLLALTLCGLAFRALAQTEQTSYFFGDTFAGAGELTGKPWEWTGWTYEVEFTGARKGKLTGDDVLGPSGLAVKKSFATPDGTVRATFTEDLKPISKAAYEILRGKLVPEQKQPVE